MSSRASLSFMIFFISWFCINYYIVNQLDLSIDIYHKQLTKFKSANNDDIVANIIINKNLDLLSLLFINPSPKTYLQLPLQKKVVKHTAINHNNTKDNKLTNNHHYLVNKSRFIANRDVTSTINLTTYSSSEDIFHSNPSIKKYDDNQIFDHINTHKQ